MNFYVLSQSVCFALPYRAISTQDAQLFKLNLSEVTQVFSPEDFMKTMSYIGGSFPDLLRAALQTDVNLLLACYRKQHDYTQSHFVPAFRILFEESIVYKGITSKIQNANNQTAI